MDVHAPDKTAAHPRVSGENDTAGKRKDNPSGSSPRERGKLAYIVFAVIVWGLIPA